MVHRGDVTLESTARNPGSTQVLQNRAFIELSRILTSGDAAVLSSALPLFVRGSGVPSAAVYRLSAEDELTFVASDGVPAKLRAYLEEPAYNGALDFVARRALKQRRTVIDSGVFGDTSTAGAHAALDEAGWQSGIAVPILAGGASGGVVLAGARAGNVDGGTVSFLEAMANLLGAALGKPAREDGAPRPTSTSSAACVALVCEALGGLGREVAAQHALVRQVCFRAESPPEADALLGHSRALERSFRHLSDVVLHLPGAAASHGKRSVSAAQVIEAAVRAAEPALIAARADVQVVCPPSCAFDADPELIALAIRHLVVNAAEALGSDAAASAAALSDGRPTLASRRFVRIRARSEGPNAVVDVEDSGLGVPPDLRPRVFEPSVTTKGAGRGIGLSLARHVVESHGGWMELGVAELGGARFSVFLPRLAPSADGLRRAPTLPQIDLSGALRRTGQ